MEIFYNSSAPGYEEIVSYGPKWWTEYKEMNAVYMFEGWLLDIMAKKMEQEVKNQFPSQADLPTLLAYEKMLRIESDVELTIQERRRIADIYYYGTGHLSGSVILQLIRAYTGHEGKVYWDGYTLCIEFNNNDGSFISLGILQKIIRRRIPAHIPFQTKCTCKVSLGLSVETGAWEKCFIQAGLLPDVNMGLGIACDGIAVKTTAQAVKITYPIAGDSGNAGIYPIISTELQTAGGDVLPKVKTESWKVVYPVCGDALGI
ncbi:putative phage tail protein [Blautia sp. MSJ-19]|uniref:putative phage tail protein n=1 Tax=Blautia sp. MSJ-19 TaxID=2841517 RepID=UPI001C0EE0CE|nr:putative phage tail protein [Blautia sp. MSJ-19]MBU5481829.1 YmfQ family protein [Blautia sp. MSJ-19]